MIRDIKTPVVVGRELEVNEHHGVTALIVVLDEDVASVDVVVREDHRALELVDQGQQPVHLLMNIKQ